MLDVYVVWSSGFVCFAVFYGFGYLVFSDVEIGVWWEFLDGSVCLSVGFVGLVFCYLGELFVEGCGDVFGGGLGFALEGDRAVRGRL